jgi:hypothetical protein
VSEESDNNGLEHLLKSTGARPFIPKSNKYDSDLFTAKVGPSLVKILQLKGMDLKIVETVQDIIHAPQIEELSPDILIRPISNSLKNLGFIALSSEFVSELIHKMMGGSDKVNPGTLEYPLTGLQNKVLTTFDPALANAMREGIKVFLGLDVIKINPPLNEIEAQELLQDGGDFFVTHLKFEGLLESSLIILLKVDAFNA